jgi:hypothetical protein
MRKFGHYLSDLTGEFPKSLVQELQSRFSIATAEELVAAAARAGDSLGSALKVDAEKWKNLVKAAMEVLSPEEQHRLAAPSQPRPGGARLRRWTPGQVLKEADEITLE